MNESSRHDLHDFMEQETQEIASEYSRIRRRTIADPGTAGDEGEENWAELIRGWIPSSYYVETKGQILTHDGRTSPQVDVLVLKPSYPRSLLSKKKYLAAGVAAAFECKTTLTSKHIEEATETCVKVKGLLDKRIGTPYKEIVSPIFYGLLAHSHSWKNKGSTPSKNIGRALAKSDENLVEHPIGQLDLVCVADLGWWHLAKMTFMPSDGSLNLTKTLFSSIAGGHVGHILDDQDQNGEFTPVGGLISFLLRRMAREDANMQAIADYFQSTYIEGSGSGKLRNWDLHIYSEAVRDGVKEGKIIAGESWSEWSQAIF